MPSNELNSPLLNYEQLLMTENIKKEKLNFYMGPVIFMDKQLKRLREAPVHIVISPERFQISIDLSIFEPEDIQLLLSKGQLVVLAEREVRINESSVVVRHFRRKISIPEDVVTDAVATQINSFGILTMTVYEELKLKEIKI
uniref:SHSP domain-containing protein n=1 Tax=Meloidogyne enterolobii TaxID=390850 RepID=A0A6V7UZB9_MELEN|nr:unnamed protein product [Meloidogyne enterolobii]